MYKKKPYNLVLNLPYYSPPSSQGDAFFMGAIGAVVVAGAAFGIGCLPLAHWHLPMLWPSIKYEAGQALMGLKAHVWPWHWPWQLALPVAAAMPSAIAAAIYGFKSNYRPGFTQQKGLEITFPDQLFQGEKNGVSIGGATMSRHVECNGLLLVSGQGGGKTVPTVHMMQQVWRRCERALILDGKPEFIAFLPNFHGDGLGKQNAIGSKTWLLALGDIRAARWAVGEDVCDRPTATRWATSLTSALAAKEGIDFWTEGSQLFISMAILLCIESFGKTWTLGDFITTLHMFLTIPPAEMQAVVKGYLPSQATLITPDALMTLAGLQANLGAAMKPLDNMVRFEAMKNPKITMSITRWMKSRDFLVIGSASTDLQASAAFANSLIELAAEKILLTTDGHPDDSEKATWLILEEFGAAGNCALLRKQLVKLRSKCCRCVLLIQSLQQVVEEYGQTAAQIILGSLGTLILGENRGGGAQGDGEWASQQMGDVTGRAWSANSGSQIGQYELVERDLVPTSEFGKLGLQWTRSWRKPWTTKDGFRLRWLRYSKAKNVRLIVKTRVNVAELVVEFPDKTELRPPMVTAELKVESPLYGRVAPSLLRIMAHIEANAAKKKEAKKDGK